ncbi:hypothetical protein Trydic_g13238 [Trypoxylus dichotomus]
MRNAENEHYEIVDLSDDDSGSDPDYEEAADEHNESDEDDESIDDIVFLYRNYIVLERPVSMQPDGESEESNDLAGMEVETESGQEWEVIGDFQNYNYQEKKGRKSGFFVIDVMRNERNW